MKKILVPTDFSALANEALRTACQLARQQKATIRLVHVLDFPLVEEEAPTGPIEILPGGYLKQAKREMKERLEQLIAKEGVEGVSITPEVRIGNPYQSSVRALVKEEIDLVVMGSRGASGIREILVGSNAERMVRHAPTPVLVVKGKTDFSDLTDIVYATALSKIEVPVLQTLSKLQRVYDAQLHLVRINTIGNFMDDPTVKEQLKYLAKNSRLKNYTLNTFSDIGEEAGIIHFADEVKADLIAVSTHGRRGLLHLLGGSVAEDIANHAQHPVWTMSLYPASE